MARPSPQPRQDVTACYDHLGGRLGENLFRFLVEKGWISKSASGRDYELTRAGWKGLESLGIDVNSIHAAKRKIVMACAERRGGVVYDHTGAYQGALLTGRLLELGWLTEDAPRQYRITGEGLTGLESLGVDMTDISGEPHQ